MKKGRTRRLAVYPQSRGLGYVVLEGQDHLVDWGRFSVRENKNRQSLKILKRLILRFQPVEFVCEDPHDPDSIRSRRISKLLARLREAATRMDIETCEVTKAQVGHAFRGRDVANKDDRALLLARIYPMLMPRLPARRELWMAEQEGMAIFDALSLLVAVVGLPEEPIPSVLERYKQLLW